MLNYILRRLLRMIPTLVVISILSFTIIQLPPGDFFDSLQAQLAESESKADQEAFDSLREQYHLDKPLWKQYLYWVGGCLQGDFGYSHHWQKPVRPLIADRIWLTILISFFALLLSNLITWPIGRRNRKSCGPCASRRP